jgi:hypothetical protein
LQGGAAFQACVMSACEGARVSARGQRSRAALEVGAHEFLGCDRSEGSSRAIGTSGAVATGRAIET